MVYYVKREHIDKKTISAYITEDVDAVTKLARGSELPLEIKELTLKDIVAYVRIQAPREGQKLNLTKFGNYNAYTVSDISAFDAYFKIVSETLKRDDFNLGKVALVEKIKQNREDLETLIASSK